jgi:hypothetical protein
MATSPLRLRTLTDQSSNPLTRVQFEQLKDALKEYEFSKVFGPTVGQEQIYEDSSIDGMLNNLLEAKR